MDEQEILVEFLRFTAKRKGATISDLVPELDQSKICSQVSDIVGMDLASVTKLYVQSGFKDMVKSATSPRRRYKAIMDDGREVAKTVRSPYGGADSSAMHAMGNGLSPIRVIVPGLAVSATSCAGGVQMTDRGTKGYRYILIQQNGE